MDNPPTDFDGAWKDALERHFEPFLALCFPNAHADIDWATPPRFLETELQQVAPHETEGKQRVDKLVQVRLREGDDAWILVHVEVQSQYDRTFAERMFRYHARLYDRYQRQVVSLAVLGDAGLSWRPDRFGYQRWGCEIANTPEQRPNTFWLPALGLRAAARFSGHQATRTRWSDTRTGR